MKLFEIPMVLASLSGLCAFSGLGTPVAHADFTFGEPVNMKSVFPWMDGLADTIDCVSFDALELYVETDRSLGGHGGYDLWVVKRASTGEDWGPLANLGPGVNTSSDELNAFISPDALTLYFTSSRPGGLGTEDIYVATRATKDAPWGQPVNLGPTVNSSAKEGVPWTTPDGLELYFRSNRAGGYGYFDIYVARRTSTNDPWGQAVNLGPVVNSAGAENFLSLSPDGLVLLFSDEPVGAAPRPGGYGGADMWMSWRASLSSPWQTPINLGSRVNSPKHDVFPRISPDGSILYFSGTSSGTWENWQTPIIPVTDFNADGKVDSADLALLVTNWGKNNSPYDIGPFAWGDGVVDEKDLKVLMESLVTPAPHAADVPGDVVLRWTSPSSTPTCDVYFGPVAALVSAASRTAPLGVLVSQGQTATTYDPPGLLEYSRTYYWRVDFVVPGSTPTIYPGPVLSFTTEAFARPIQNITASASSSQPSMGPEETVDGSGLDKNDGHSTDGKDMWLSMGVQPNWIQYQFDKAYVLHELWVWNSNQLIEPFLGFGAKSVKIEYSTDGTKWTQLADVPEFARAPGQPGYVHNTTVSFGGVAAQYVKLTIEKNWGVAPQTGLSEVRFFCIQGVAATKP